MPHQAIRQEGGSWLSIVEGFMASDESPPSYKLSVREWTQWRMQAKIKGGSHVRKDICCSYHRNHEGTKLLQMSDFATDIHVGRERRITLVPPSPSRTFDRCSGPSATYESNSQDSIDTRSYKTGISVPGHSWTLAPWQATQNWQVAHPLFRRRWLFSRIGTAWTFMASNISYALHFIRDYMKLFGILKLFIICLLIFITATDYKIYHRKYWFWQ